MTYITKQFERIERSAGSEFKPSIKVHSETGETNCLAISWEGLARIKQILLEEEAADLERIKAMTGRHT